MRCRVLVPLLALSACAVDAPAVESPRAAEAVAPRSAPLFRPTGARIEPSGFASVERAPPRRYSDAPPPAEDRPTSEAGWYARSLGISEAEATRRKREQNALRPELERLTTLLRQREAGNFTALRVIHQPDWAYEFYFKRDPQSTLARYTVNPRFRAALARYTREELEALIKPWTERFTRHRLTGGWGLDDTRGRAEIMMDVTEEEYREVAAREGWGALPDTIDLRFSSPVRHPAVEEAARPFVRLLAQNNRGTGIQLTAGTIARIVLRDGCLIVGGATGPYQLAYFHRETGIGVDADGYLVLKDRMTGENRGRIGEWFSWAGPNAVDETSPMVKELRTRCGSAPLLNVGNPSSAYQFRVRAWQIDDLARQRRISRQEAWDRLKRCWARSDAAKPDGPPSGECNL
jgi:hypothetical protein